MCVFVVLNTLTMDAAFFYPPPGGYPPEGQVLLLRLERGRERTRPPPAGVVPSVSGPLQSASAAILGSSSSHSFGAAFSPRPLHTGIKKSQSQKELTLFYSRERTRTSDLRVMSRGGVFIIGYLSLYIVAL